MTAKHKNKWLKGLKYDYDIFKQKVTDIHIEYHYLHDTVLEILLYK